jgi:tetratricopeptide (TPR) repeat protein
MHKEHGRMKQFTVLAALSAVLLWAGCSRLPAGDVLRKAQDDEELARKMLDTMRVKPDGKKYFQNVVSEYSTLVDHYEESPEAAVALFRRAAIRNNDTKEHELAIEDYKLYARRYPTDEKTPVAMFLVGYIYNNELHNLDSAAAAYRRFLAAFPQNEMASSAQFELDNLGKSPDELVPPEPQRQKPPPRQVAKKKS